MPGRALQRPWAMGIGQPKSKVQALTGNTRGPMDNIQGQDFKAGVQVLHYSSYDVYSYEERKK